MTGNDLFGGQQLNRLQGIIRPHSEIIANGQNGQVDALFTIELHIHEEGGIAGEVELFAFDGEEQTCRIATVASIGQSRTMMGDSQLEITKVMVETTS